MLLDGEASRFDFEDAFDLDRHPVMQLLHADGRPGVAPRVSPTYRSCPCGAGLMSGSASVGQCL